MTDPRTIADRMLACSLSETEVAVRWSPCPAACGSIKVRSCRVPISKLNSRAGRSCTSQPVPVAVLTRVNNSVVLPAFFYETYHGLAGAVPDAEQSTKGRKLRWAQIVPELQEEGIQCSALCCF